MNIDDLSKIKRVDLPPHLATLIRQRITAAATEVIPKTTAWVLASTLVVVILLNIGAVVNSNSRSRAIQDYAGSMNLNSDNSLYQ